MLDANASTFKLRRHRKSDGLRKFQHHKRWLITSPVDKDFLRTSLTIRNYLRSLFIIAICFSHPYSSEL